MVTSPSPHARPSRWVATTGPAWQVAVSITFVIGLLRVNPTTQALPVNVWLGLQLLPLLAVSLLMLLSPTIRAADPRMRRVATAGLALVAFCALSTLWSSAPFRTLSQSFVLALGLGFLYLTGTRRWRDGPLRADLALLLALGAATLLVGVALRLTGAAVTVGVGRRLEGVAGNPNYLGMYLFVVVATALALVAGGLSQPRLLVVAVIVGLSGIGLLWSASRGSIMATGVAVLAALASSAVRSAIRAGWQPVAAGLVLGAVAGTAAWSLAPDVNPPSATTSTVSSGTSDSSSPESLLDRRSVGSGATTGRVDIWRNAASQAMNRPLGGYGYRTTEERSETGLTTHNLFLSFLVETGVVGLLIFVGLLVALLHAGWRRNPLRMTLLGAGIGILLQEQVEASLQAFSGPVALAQWLLLLAFAASGSAAWSHHVQDHAGAAT